MPHRVDNARILEAVELSGTSIRELARRLDCNESTLRRALGKSPFRQGTYGPYTAKRIEAQTAVRILRAIHLAPVDFGL